MEKTHKLKVKGQPCNEEKMETEEVKSQEKMKTDKVEFCTMDRSSSLRTTPSRRGGQGPATSSDFYRPDFFILEKCRCQHSWKRKDPEDEQLKVKKIECEV